MISVSDGTGRVFLFLQGPHGPFFWQLAQQLRSAGAEVWRVGFNAGDRAFWPHRPSYIPHLTCPEGWADHFAEILIDKNVTDLVLYGDARSIHAQAIEVAKANHLRVHVFEEGYLRPFWITYERNGSNGNSMLMDITLDDMRRAQAAQLFAPPVPPSHWGDVRKHIFYGALYHFFVLVANFRYSHFKPHRDLTVAQEFRLYLQKLCLLPLHSIERKVASVRIKRGRFPYHLALLQLAHDASFVHYGPFQKQSDFIDCVIKGFAAGAPRHHHLVFKAHPLEDGRESLRKIIQNTAKAHGLSDRVHFVRGGKLADLLDEARSAITVNSTAGQQVLWRGLPLRCFGASVYDKDELVSRQNLTDFFSRPEKPAVDDYSAFRDFLLSTSQLPGSFYAAKGRRQVLRRMTDMMLATDGPYHSARDQNAADKQHLTIVR